MTAYNIIKPKTDKKEYKYTILNNQLSVLFIYDEDTDISAASLTVEAGYYDDPKDTPGLAHFLEHMLFMGTEKYPDEDYYHKFINESGGSSNAHTMNESTSYYFQVLNKYFMKAIDLFAQFFISPLLLENSIEREMKAVNSEHMKNLSFDDARTDSIIRGLVKNNHPYSKFGTGSIDTLKKNNIRQLLIDLYNRTYSANLMKLVVLTNRKIEENIIELFSQIKNKNIERTIIKSKPFEINKNSLCINLIKIIPNQESNTLLLFWQLMNVDKYYHYKPLEYIAYLLGHESEGSIFNYLKTNDLCMQLSAGVFNNDSSINFLGLYIILTDKGLKYVPNIIECIYQYIDLINEHGINQTFYDETKQMKQLNFDFMRSQDPIDYVVQLSMNMTKYEPKDIIYGGFRMDNFNDKIIRKCMEYIRKNNSIIAVSSKIYAGKTNKKDKWYNASYIAYHNPETYGDEFLHDKMNYNLHLPIKNIFIPKDITTKISKKSKDKSKYPIRLKDSKHELWFMMGHKKFDNPKVYCNFILYFDDFYKHAKNFILMQMYIELIEVKLKSTLYYAGLFSTIFTMSILTNCISINFIGFNDTIEKIIDIILEALLNIKIDENSYEMTKYELNENLKNFVYNPAYILVQDYFKEKLYTINYTNQELQDASHQIEYKDILIPQQWFLKGDCYSKIFIYGNIEKEKAIELSQKFNRFQCNDEKKLVMKNKIITLSKGEQHVYVKKSLNEIDENYVILLFFEIGNIINKVTPDWDIDTLCLAILDVYTKEIFFSELRTKEQLGYIVRSFQQQFVNEKGTFMGLSFLIQSPTTDPEKLKKKIKQFINKMFLELKGLDNKKIELYKSITKNLISKKFISNDEEFSFMGSEIIFDSYIFNYRELLTRKINDITKDILIAFYEKHFINKNTRKIRILELLKNEKI
jgi:insulysin